MPWLDGRFGLAGVCFEEKGREVRETGRLWSQGLVGGCDTPPGSHTASLPPIDKEGLAPRDSPNPAFLEDIQQSSPNTALCRQQPEYPT